MHRKITQLVELDSCSMITDRASCAKQSNKTEYEMTLFENKHKGWVSCKVMKVTASTF